MDDIDTSASLVNYRLGDITITALSDGYFELPLEHFVTGLSATEIADALTRLHRPGMARIDINAFLLQRPGKPTILIDSGLGEGMMLSAGHLPASLRKAGVGPEEIDIVLLSHLHGDHCRGLIRPDGSATYPRARILVAATEAAYWLDGEASGHPDPDGLAIARAALAPYAQRLERFEPGEILPGIVAVPLPGHSPGHTGFRIGGAGGTMLIWGDIVNVPSVQVLLPESGVVSDADTAQAIATRLAVFREVAASGEIVAGMHIDYPGLARVAHQSGRYQLMAIDR